MSDVAYRPDHTYWLDSKQIPGITGVLADLGYNGQGGRFYTQKSRERGTGVHLACPIADRAAPDCFDLPEVLAAGFEELHLELRQYLAGWLLFKKEKQYRPVAWETPLASRKLRIACTFDNWGFSQGGVYTVTDMKSWKQKGAHPSRSSELQTGFQELVLKENKIIPADAIVRRYVVKLSGDGKYRSYLCDNPLDVQILHDIARVWWDLKTAKLVAVASDADNNVAAVEED